MVFVVDTFDWAKFKASRTKLIAAEKYHNVNRAFEQNETPETPKYE